MQDERQPLRRRQCVEHHGQRLAQGVRQERLVLRLPTSRSRRTQVVERLLPTHGAPAVRVEADPADDGGQPGGEVVHAWAYIPPMLQLLLGSRSVRYA